MLEQLTSRFAANCTEPVFFGLKPWYHYLETEADCTVKNFHVLNSNGTSDFGLIALALIDDLLRIGGMVAIAFVIYGGILYINSQGSPDQTAKAQTTIQNALIGLVICLLAVAIVSFIGNRIS